MNQAPFIEETLRSVLLQSYPDLEYIVLDGGSSDGSQAIIERYGAHLAYWVSRADGGQAAAVVDGFRRATGEVVGFLNSDDVLLPGALLAVAAAFARSSRVEFAVGRSVVIDQQGTVLHHVPGLLPTYRSLLFWCTGGFNQPATFFRRSALAEADYFDTSLRFAFDYDLFLRMARRGRAEAIPRFLAAFRIHPGSKTSTLNDIRLREDELLKTRFGLYAYPAAVRALAKAAYQARYYLAAMRLRSELALGRGRPPARGRPLSDIRRALPRAV